MQTDPVIDMPLTPNKQPSRSVLMTAAASADRLKLEELRQHQTGLEQQVAEHEQELNSLREYFQEKVRFTENM